MRLHRHTSRACQACAAFGEGMSLLLPTASADPCAPAMLLDTDRIELFICASRSTTAFTGMAVAALHITAALARWQAAPRVPYIPQYSWSDPNAKA